MTVYVEYALLDNFCMDFFLLFCAAVTLKIPFRIPRVLLGAAVGAAIAVVSVYLNGILLFCVRAACLFCMCAVAVGFGKKLFWYILLTLAYTFLTGGAIVGIFNLFGIASDGLFYNMPVPLFVYFIGIGAVAFLCYTLSVFVKQTRRNACFLVRTRVSFCGKSFDVNGFCDSGNTVLYRGKPVCFVTKKFGCVSECFAEAILKNNVEKIEIATLAGQKSVLAVEAIVEVRGRTREAFIALPAEKCKAPYELLLNSEFCDMGNKE